MSEDPNVNWTQANLAAIQIDTNADAWRAGHVNDVLPRAGRGACKIMRKSRTRFRSSVSLLPASDIHGAQEISRSSRCSPRM
jgi:hypothetical protein